MRTIIGFALALASGCQLLGDFSDVQRGRRPEVLGGAGQTNDEAGGSPQADTSDGIAGASTNAGTGSSVGGQVGEGGLAGAPSALAGQGGGDQLPPQETAGQGGADGTEGWVEVVTATAPSSRDLAAFVYDDASDTLFFFGGDQYVPTQEHRADLWLLRGSTGLGQAAWVPATPTGTGPSGRYGTSAVYDATNDRLVLHGGCGGYCQPAFGETWLVENATKAGGKAKWSPLPSASQTRHSHAAAYDATSNRMIIHGGDSGSSKLTDTWVLIDANGIGTPKWEQLTPSGTAPNSTGTEFAAYDPITNRLFVCPSAQGTLSIGSVFVLEHANGLGGTPEWRQPATQGLTPEARMGFPVLFDEQEPRLLIVGGSTVAAPLTGHNDVWSAKVTFDPARTAWEKLVPDITQGQEAPGVRFWHAAGYSTKRSTLVVTSGEARAGNAAAPEYTRYTDTWRIRLR